MLKIGSHVSMGGKDMMLGSVREALSYGANTFMLYTGAPQNTRRKDVSELKVNEAWALMKENGLEEFIVHAPYIINLANTVKDETYRIAMEFLAVELKRTRAMGSKVLVLHPGSHVSAGVPAGIAQVVKGLNAVLSNDTDVYVALETMAGKGSELGRSFDELAMIYDGVVHNDKLRVCFDTCHTSDAGYDIIHDFDGVMEQFDKVIGKDQIAVFHINDSKNAPGAAKDRHENIGFGTIGFDALMKVITCKDFEDVPKILETPYVKDPMDAKKSYPPYKQEIEMIRTGVFNPELINEILKEHA
ncbi:MAG: deoxyribonuclease IV [Clostridium sp.]|nr:deoxyribonuclease IV [Clostridium sp.]MCM1398364.1 deoxyribonuclease IV [Clostridium sp.]MCM1458971.1 deoxyribonuclease IV [Bacteroides sp.]